MRAWRRGMALLVFAVAWVDFAAPRLMAATGAPSRTPSVLRLPFPQDDGSLTPYSFELGYSLLTLVYDTLLWRDEDGIPRPWLARSVETSGDGRQLTVRLADGARWHDGRAVTAEDVAFTFRMVAAWPHPRFTGQLRAVEEVEAVDASTAVIRLRHPSPGFLDQPLADLPIVPAHIWAGLHPGELPQGRPVGSGPFRLVEHRPGRRYVFVAEEAYFKGRPAVPRIEVPVIRELEGTVLALEEGRVDMIPVSLPARTARRVKQLGVRLVEGPHYLGTTVVFNLRREPFDRVEVRKALSAALDLASIARAAGDAVPAEHGLIHPASPWSSPEPLHVFDPSASRAAAAPRVERTIQVIAPRSDAVHVEAARQVALAFQRAGIPAEADPVEKAEYARALGQDGSSPSFDAAIVPVAPLASYDPDHLIRQFGGHSQDLVLNPSGYGSAAFAEIADRVARTTDPAARRSVVVEMLRLLAADAPAVPLYFSSGTFGYRPARYDGWRFVKGTGILDKQSLLVAGAASSTTVPTVPPPSPSTRSFPLALAALGLLAGALAVASVALFRGRSS